MIEYLRLLPVKVMQDSEYYLNRDVLVIIFDYLWPDFVAECRMHALQDKFMPATYIQRLATVSKGWAKAICKLRAAARAYLGQKHIYKYNNFASSIEYMNTRGIIKCIAIEEQHGENYLCHIVLRIDAEHNIEIFFRETYAWFCNIVRVDGWPVDTKVCSLFDRFIAACVKWTDLKFLRLDKNGIKAAPYDFTGHVYTTLGLQYIKEL